MITLKGNNGTNILRGPTVSDGDVVIDVQSSDTLISGYSSGEIQIADVIYDNTTYATVDKSYKINVYNTNSNPFEGYTSLNPSVGTIDNNGVITRVSDGDLGVLIKTKLVTKRVDVEIVRENGATINVFNRFANGSLAKHCMEQVANRIQGKNPLTALPIYSTINHATPNYIRNVNSWLYGVDDITCLAVGAKPATSTSFWSNQGGTLISPRHVVYANHWGGSDNSPGRLKNGQLCFLSTDNQVVTKTITNDIYLDNDLVVGVLDSDVPSTVKYAKMFSGDLHTKYAPIGDGYPITAFGVTHSNTIQPIGSKQATIRGYKRQVTNTAYFSHVDTNPEWYRDVILYDSGHPAFAIVNDQLVLLTTWWSGGAGRGPNMTYYINDINSAMTTLGGGYQLTITDLSTFTDYSE